MKLETDAKFKEEWSCHYKTDMRNLKNMTRALKNLKTLHINGLFN